MSLEDKIRDIDKYVNIWVHMRVSSKTLKRLRDLGANPKTKTYDVVINEILDMNEVFKTENERLRNQNDALQSAIISQVTNGNGVTNGQH